MPGKLQQHLFAGGIGPADETHAMFARTGPVMAHGWVIAHR